MPFIPYAVVEDDGPDPALPVSAGLIAWWDPSDTSSFTYRAGDTNGPSIQSLQDKSGTANHAVAAGAYASSGIPPQLNSRRAMVAMMTAAYWGPLSSSFNDTSSTFFTVMTPAYISANQPIFGPSAINGLIHYVEITTGLFTTGSLGNPGIGQNPTPITPGVVAVVSSALAPTTCRTYVNGVGDFDTVTVPISGTPSMYLGNSHLIGQFQGWIGETLIYDTTLNQTDQEAVQSYLMTKWLR